jgi:hypothetical protein
MQQPPLLAGQRIQVALAQEADIALGFQIVQRLRVGLKFAVKQLDGALVLQAAIDGHLLSGTLRLEGDARHFDIKGNRDGRGHQEHQQEREAGLGMAAVGRPRCERLQPVDGLFRPAVVPNGSAGERSNHRLLTRHPSGIHRVDVAPRPVLFHRMLSQGTTHGHLRIACWLQCTTYSRLWVCCWRAAHPASSASSGKVCWLLLLNSVSSTTAEFTPIRTIL